MSKILAIDTSSEACSASLLINNQAITRFEITPQAHTDRILPMCDELLVEAQLNLGQLDAIGFSRGPGSFTGLRIGAGVAQGLAYSKDLPVINISSLEALATSVSRNSENIYVIAAIDARMQEIYWSQYCVDSDHNVSSLGDELLSKPEDIHSNLVGNAIGVGSGWILYQESLKNRFKSLNFDHIYSKQLVSAEEIAFLAANKYANGQWHSAEAAVPVYLRNNIAQKA